MATLKKYSDVSEDLNLLSQAVVDSFFQVHQHLGPGYLEKLYEDCLCMELAERGIAFQRQFPIKLTYKGKVIPSDFNLRSFGSSRSKNPSEEA